ncbi:MAG: hypothetical protein AAFX45_14540 [Pseudomonadota bacterium]
MIRYAVLFSLLAGQASALTLEACTRPVAIHGEEYGHTDLTGGLVLWGQRWTNEGAADDLHMVDCQTGDALTARMMSRGMSEIIPYDRRAQAGQALQTLLAGSVAFLNLDRAQGALEGARVPVERSTLRDEPCACAALYPDDRGNRFPFRAGQ